MANPVLGNYESMEDHVSFDDLADALVVPIPDQTGQTVAFFAQNTSTLVEFTVQRVPSPRVFTAGLVPPRA